MTPNWIVGRLADPAPVSLRSRLRQTPVPRYPEAGDGARGRIEGAGQLPVAEPPPDDPSELRSRLPEGASGLGLTMTEPVPSEASRALVPANWAVTTRWPAVAGMVSFRNNVGSAALTNWVSPSSQQIAFGRGALGFVAINNADSAWSATFSTSLPDGTYCDVISGVPSNGTCAGASCVHFTCDLFEL